MARVKHATGEAEGSFVSLPPEMLLHMVELMEPQAVLNLCKTSHEMAGLCREPKIRAWLDYAKKWNSSLSYTEYTRGPSIEFQRVFGDDGQKKFLLFMFKNTMERIWLHPIKLELMFEELMPDSTGDAALYEDLDNLVDDLGLLSEILPETEVEAVPEEEEEIISEEEEEYEEEEEGQYEHFGVIKDLVRGWEWRTVPLLGVNKLTVTSTDIGRIIQLNPRGRFPNSFKENVTPTNWKVVNNTGITMRDIGEGLFRMLPLKFDSLELLTDNTRFSVEDDRLTIMADYNYIG